MGSPPGAASSLPLYIHVSCLSLLHLSGRGLSPMPWSWQNSLFLLLWSLPQNSKIPDSISLPSDWPPVTLLTSQKPTGDRLPTGGTLQTGFWGNIISMRAQATEKRSLLQLQLSWAPKDLPLRQMGEEEVWDMEQSEGGPGGG